MPERILRQETSKDSVRRVPCAINPSLHVGDSPNCQNYMGASTQVAGEHNCYNINTVVPAHVTLRRQVTSINILYNNMSTTFFFFSQRAV